MDVQLTEAQRLLSESVRDWLRRRWPESAARQHFGDQEMPQHLWEELSTLGWLGVGVSERGGGSGGGLSDVVTLQEQLGTWLFPTLVGSTLVVGRLLDRACVGQPVLQSTLASLVAGKLPATIAVQEASGGFLSLPNAVLRREGPDWRLTGDKRFVRDAGRAKLIAVRAAVDDGPASAWALVDAASIGVVLTPQQGSAHDGQHRVAFEDVLVPDERIVVTDDDATLADAMVLEAARLSGVGSRAHSMAVEYAKVRVQFGRPIGSFQAIQHKVADMTTDVESASLTAYLAAFSLEAGQEGFLHALVAKQWASEAIQRVVSDAHQIHGGIGYITDHPLHLYFRNAMTGALLFGAPNELASAIAARVLTPSQN